MPDVCWTRRDMQVTEALGTKVTCLAEEQIARGWWGDCERPGRSAGRRLHHLGKAGLVERYRVNVHPVLRVTEPIVNWSPGQAMADFERVATVLRNRWTEPAVPTTVYVASRKTANLFGTFAGKLPRLLARDHDLLLGEVFVFYVRTNPRIAARWIGEEALPKAGYRIKDPDAFVLDKCGRPVRVIESAGRYGVKQLTSFHEYCAERGLPYELW